MRRTSFSFQRLQTSSIILLFSFCCHSFVFSQSQGRLTTENYSDVEDLIKNVFIKGSCANVFNIQSIGSRFGIGRFDKGASVIEMEQGIILSSGLIEDAVGPNENNETTFRYGDFSGDPDLSQIATSVVADPVGIEFDFIPIGNQVSFNYVFASEEYCEFVGSIFNDVFGFFVSGPGINGTFSDNGINVARIPDTEEFVSINNVNSQRNASFYIKNELAVDASVCNVQFAPQYLEDIEYDGFTIRLKAKFEVIPCETYHIRLLVGDVADDKLDSAVFLEAKSFDLGESVSVTANAFGSDDNIAYEGCTDGEFIFSRAGNLSLEEDLDVNFRLVGDAINGIDYESQVQQITIPAGSAKVSLPIKVIADEIEEQLEEVMVVLDYDCKCIPKDTSQLFISDIIPIEATFPKEILVCEGQEFSLEPTVRNAIEPMSFAWDVGDTTRALTRVINDPSHFVVTVVDACGRRDSTLAEVKIQDQPMAQLEGDLQWCNDGSDTFLEVDLGGNPPWTLTYAVNGENQMIDNITANPFQILIREAGTYELLQFRDANCLGIGKDESLVTLTGVEIAEEITPTTCSSSEDGRIQIEILEGTPPFAIRWEEFSHDLLQVENLTVGSYTLNITDAANCRVEKEFVVSFVQPVPAICEVDLTTAIYIPNAFSPNGDGVNELFQVYPKLDVINAFSFQILDRWGNLIFQSPLSNTLGSWNGEGAGIGVYVCVVEAVLIDGTKQYIAKDVTLVR
ncbi:MAG: choice-of-anchor L domain-containing protein [Bacteroidota bacterium]